MRVLKAVMESLKRIKMRGEQGLWFLMVFGYCGMILAIKGYNKRIDVLKDQIRHYESQEECKSSVEQGDQ